MPIYFINTGKRAINIVPSLLLLITIITLSDLSAAENLMCYQCERKSDVECSEKDLLPCPSTSDRCVTYMTREGGFRIKRECGLGPCAFDDNMANKALGIRTCDINESSFCLTCCKENGCNKNDSQTRRLPKLILLLFVAISIVILNIRDNFQPPYMGKTHKSLA